MHAAERAPPLCLAIAVCAVQVAPAQPPQFQQPIAEKKAEEAPQEVRALG